MKDKAFYDKLREIKDLTKNLPWVDKVPKRFVRMDREVKTKLEELIKDRPELVNIVRRLRTDFRARNEWLSSRRMLLTLYGSLAVTTTIFEVIGLKSISNLNWWGDKWAEEFYTEFMRRYNVMGRQQGALTDNQVRDLLHHELTKSTGAGSFEADLRDWEKQYKEPERTFFNLLSAFRQWIDQAYAAQQFVVVAIE